MSTFLGLNWLMDCMAWLSPGFEMGMARSLDGFKVCVKSNLFSPTIHRMDTKKLDLNLLVTLETLLVEQNVTRAAERLHLSQPAVSTQLSRLRELFDDPLLIPVQRGMAPTAKALELLAPLRLALDQVRATLAEHRRFDPARAGLSVAIACTDYLQATLVQPLAVALRKRAPGLRLAVHHLDPSRLEAQMASGEVDLALMTPEHGPGSLRSRHLFDERYVLIGRQRHPGLRHGLTVEQFAQLDHVIVSLRGGALAVTGAPRDNVIATGGGVVTVPGNRAILAQNCASLLIERPLSELPASGRPVTQKKGVDALYRERKPLYDAWSEKAYENHDIRETAQRIAEDYA